MYDEFPRIENKPSLAFAGKVAKLPQKAKEVDVNPPKEAIELKGALRLCDGRVAEPGTQIWLGYDEHAIAVWWKCEEPNIKSARRDPGQAFKLHRRDYFYDRIEFFLDTQHDHKNYFHLFVELGGAVEVHKASQELGEDVGSGPSHEEKVDAKGVLAKTVKDQDSWSGCCVIPYSVLQTKVSMGSVWGFNFLRVRTPYPPFDAFWSFRWSPAHGIPLFYGDLYFDHQVVVRQIDFPNPVYGENLAKISGSLVGKVKQPLKAQIHVTLPYEKSEVGIFESKVKTKGDSFSIDAKYVLSDRGRWPGQTSHHQKVDLKILDADGVVHFFCSYPFAYDTGVIISEPYGKGILSQPRLSDDAYETKRRAILEKIPVFHRATTNQGASSDFMLIAPDGSVKFNLMDADILDQIGNWLVKTFPSDTDRLLGAMYFLHQRSVMRHSGIRNRFVGGMSSETVLRMGGSLCGTRAQLLTTLLSRTPCAATGKPYVSLQLGLIGHIVCAVEVWPGYLKDFKPLEKGLDEWANRVLVLDCDVGGMFLTPDASRIATLAELRHDRSISYRANMCQFRHDHEFYYNARHQRLQYRQYTNHWPIPTVNGEVEARELEMTSLR